MRPFTAGEKLAYLKMMKGFKEAGLIESDEDFDMLIEEAQRILDQKGDPAAPAPKLS